MPSVKKGVTFFALFFVIGWMFFLGILVGRKTAPVHFDTRGFQEWLGEVAQKSGKKKTDLSQTDLQYYNVLRKAMPEEKVGDGTAGKKEEIVPISAENEDTGEPVAVKRSKKKMTFDTTSSSKVVAPVSERQEPSPAASSPAEKSEAPATPEKSAAPDKPAATDEGAYTIQIAAYKDFKDALAQMKRLESKGYKPYKTMARKDGSVWHRVRTGSFSNMTEARACLAGLKEISISGIIIKKDK